MLGAFAMSRRICLLRDFGIQHVLGVRVVGRQRADRREEHAHRVGVPVETFEDRLDVDLAAADDS